MVQLFSAADGRDLGCLITKGDQGHGDLLEVRWLQRGDGPASIVVGHRVNDLYHISTVEFVKYGS